MIRKMHENAEIVSGETNLENEAMFKDHCEHHNARDPWVWSLFG